MFSWIPIYRELAAKVLEFEDNQAELLALIKSMKAQGLLVISLKDKGPGDTDIELREMDPFTFFANFNRAIRTNNRQAIIRELKTTWNLTSEVPSDFEGIPLVDLRAAWFFPFARNRNRDDVSKLWRLAGEAFTKSPSEFDRQLLTDSLPIRTVSLGKLTIGMFWLNPSVYISADSRNLRYLAGKGIGLANKTAEAYFEFLGEVSVSIGADFVAISREAYQSTVATGVEGATEEDKKEEEFRYWAISAGHRGEQWPEFLDKGIIAVDWDLGGDLREFNTKEQVRQRLSRVTPGHSSRRNDALACWQFVHDMRVGDVVFAKQGTDRLLRCGWVTGDYRYEPSLNHYQHLRQVTWLSSGGPPWILPDAIKIAYKTLTDITAEADLLEFVRSKLRNDSNKNYWIGDYVNQMRERYGLQVRRAAIVNMSRLFGLKGEENVEQLEFMMRWASPELLERAPTPTTVQTIVNSGVRGSENQILVLERAIKEAPPGKNPSKELIKKIIREMRPEPPVPRPAPIAVRHWWLNLNPKEWDIEGLAVGEAIAYTSHNGKGNKRRKPEHFAGVSPGDLLLGCSTSPRPEIVAVCEVTKGLFGQGQEERITFRKIEQLGNPVGYDELKDNPALAQAEPLMNNNQGSLFALTGNEFEVVRDLIDEKNPAPSKLRPLPYDENQALSEMFMTEQELAEVMARLRLKKNLVLQGPPGVGKTFVAQRLAWVLIGARDESRLEMVQFHQSYAYEDFVQGIRPSGGAFVIKTGLFYEFCRKARAEAEHPEKPYVFIIDEINRGNLSKIFGELMMLLEHDKRGRYFAIPLTYSPSGDDRFYVPKNLYIIGTMNTADRSLSLVDYALRRRFAFFNLEPKFSSGRFAQALRNAGAAPDLIKKIQARVGALNKDISDDTRNLGPGYCIGHSYFCTDGNRIDLDENWYRRVIESEIKPLLEEYWVDNETKVRELVTSLLD